MNIKRDDFRAPSRFVGVVLTLCLGFSSALLADPPSSPGELLEIAELNDLFFHDADQGWAVGDRGAIWQTQSGGRNWQLVDSPATCRLESIHFCDPNHGWIVGGWVHPLTHVSSAAVLYTENGGRKWTRLDAPNIPALKWVYFHEPRRGWAAGNTSSLYASGFYSTEDGGRTWNEMPVERSEAIVAATVGDQRQLFGIGRSSSLLAVLGNRAERCAMPELRSRKLHDITWHGKQGWAVGDDGTILTTTDGGRIWLPPPGKLPDNLAGQFDWQTVASSGPQCWIAGTPGTVVLYTPDGGLTWQVNRTRHRLPIRRIRFTDEQHGWAVGAFGGILATRDGGRSWRVQRKGSERAALAGVFSTSERVPWELFANVSAENGYCSVVEIANTRPVVSVETSDDERSHAAAVAAGAAGSSTAWRFPVDHQATTQKVENTIAKWYVSPGSSSIQALEQHIVRQIRIWQPDVIVCDTVSSDGSQPLAHFVSQVTMRAAQSASDPAMFTDQIILAGLEPWSAKKIFTTLPPGQLNGFMLDLERLAVHLGCSLGDYAAISRGLVSTHREPPPTTLGLRLVGGSTPHDNSSRDIFAGITPSTVGESRRAAVANTGVTMETLGRALDERRAFQQLTSQRARKPDDASVILPQLDNVLRGRSPHQVGILLDRLAQRFLAQNEVTVAAAIETRFVERLPDHMFSESALLWLLRYYGSAEWQRAVSPQLADANKPTIAVRLPPANAEDDSATPRDMSSGVQPASFSAPVTISPGEAEAMERLHHAEQIGKVLQMRHGAVYHSPATQFRLASIQRQLGNDLEVTRIINGLNRASLSLGWRRALRAEQWLRGDGREPILVALECSLNESKPYLDGKLEESFWASASAAVLQGRSGESNLGTEVRFSHDGHFFYLGARCIKDPGSSYVFSKERRTRDANVTGNDHLEFFIDVDRDYTSAFQLRVDYRGWTHDACEEIRGWNPNWHVAAVNGEQEWAFEAAIPLAELDALVRDEHEPWAIRVRRNFANGESLVWPPARTDGDEPREAALLFFAASK